MSFCRNLPILGKVIKLYDKYDTTFLNLLAMQYFNQGSKVLVSLATQDLFKAYYHLSPSQVQVLMAFIGIPWSLKLFYGIISDNLPVFGSRRRSYLLIFATIQFLSMVGLSILSTGSENSAAFMLFLTSLSVAFSDVIVDSLMVI